VVGARGAARGRAGLNGGGDSTRTKIEAHAQTDHSRSRSAPTMAAAKPFPADGAGSLHDLSTYAGRVAHFSDMVDLRNVLVSDADVRGAADLLAAHKRGAAPAGTTDAALWAAKKGACACARARAAVGCARVHARARALARARFNPACRCF
jgi:hypothetical protein